VPVAMRTRVIKKTDGIGGIKFKDAVAVVVSSLSAPISHSHSRQE